MQTSLAGAAVGVVLAAGLGWLLHDFTLGTGLVHLSYDLLLVARPVIAAREAVIVYLDEKSHEELRQPYTAPWDRSLHARLVDRLTAAGARAIVFDIVFSGPTTPEADARFAEAIQRSGRVILGADHVPDGAGGKRFVMPFDPFRESAADIGSVELDPDRDLIVRRHPSNRELIASLGWVTARFLKAPVTRAREGELTPRWLNYHAPANATPSVPYYQALDAQAVPDETFRGKVVFVGANLLTRFSGERKDEFRTPHTFWISEVSRQRFISGVEVHALACLNLLRGDWLERLSGNGERMLILLWGALFGLALIQCRPWTASGLAVLALAGLAFGAYELFVRERIWFPWLILAAQLAGALLWSIVFNSIRLYVENRLYVQSLELYLSPKLVKKFARDKRLLQPGAQKQTLTILFTDIANFTSLSEGMDSDELARLMNQYFQRAVAECIHPTDGTVVKYIGDAIFAFWNAPDPQPDHAVRACEAALRLRDLPQTLVRGRPLITRLGLHTGEANVGNFGSSRRADYTAIGENINLASRMEGLNKYLGTQVLLTGDTQRLVADRFVTRPLGRFRLKGFEKSVEVFELIGPPSQADATSALRHVFAQALRHFQAREFGDAEVAFRRALEIAPDDGPARFYLHYLAELRDQVLPEGWTGEVELKEK